MSLSTTSRVEKAGSIDRAHSVSGVAPLRPLVLIFLCATAIQWFSAICYYKFATDLKFNKHPFTFYKPVNFSDLWNYTGKLTHPVDAISVYSGEPVFNYPAPAAFVYSFYLNRNHPALWFSLTLIACMLVFGVLLARALAHPPVRKWEAWGLVVALLLMAYPLQYDLFRSNLEGFAWCLFGGGIACYLAHKDLATSLFWALGVLIKPFPVLLFLLLLRRRKYREIVAGAVLGLAVELVTLKALGPTVWQALRAMGRGLALYKSLYILSYRHTEARFQHSILDSMKALAQHRYIWPAIVTQSPVIVKLYHIYQVIALVLATVCILVFRKMPGLNQFFAIVLVTLLLTPVGADYTLLLIYGIVAAFLLYLARDVATGRTEISRPAVLTILLFFSLVLSPRNWLKSYGGCITTMALLGLLWMAARQPMYSSFFDDNDSSAGPALTADA